MCLFNGLAAMNRAYGEEVIRAARRTGFDAEAAINQFIKPRQLKRQRGFEEEGKGSKAPALKSQRFLRFLCPGLARFVPVSARTSSQPWFAHSVHYGAHGGRLLLQDLPKQADSNANGKPLAAWRIVWRLA